MDLTFKRATKEKEIREVFDYNIDAFSDSPDFNWTFDEIKKEIKEGWELYGVYAGTEVIAAVFLREEDGGLLSKNTAIKIMHQGSGYSHQIKEFIDIEAISRSMERVIHYCRIDNFRMYSLNESHGYKKSAKKIGDGQVVEWVKELR